MSAMHPMYVEAIGIFAPGLVGWNQARPILAGESSYTAVAPPALKPAKLAPDVRRRTTDHIRLAVEVASEATQARGAAANLLPSVFATSDADGAITHDICQEVAKPQPQVSPTRFHNSVTNAPAGYWCMAIGSQAPSTSVAGYDGTFAVGLLDCALQLGEAADILLVAHDTPMPEPLQSARPFSALFGVALVLTRERAPNSLARLELALTDAAPETRLPEAALEQLRLGNPAARALPLLTALAQRRAANIQLPYLDDRGLSVRIEPLV
jgi:hypothetical protein